MKLACIQNRTEVLGQIGLCKLQTQIRCRRERGIETELGGQGIWKFGNTLRTARRATSEDSDHLPMQGHSDFAICGDKQACKLQFF